MRWTKFEGKKYGYGTIMQLICIRTKVDVIIVLVDPWFLVGDYPDLTNLILTARKINDSMPTHVLGRIRDIMREHNITDISKIGLYGLVYKENVDDIRESPTLQLLKRMDEHLDFGVKVYDPFGNKRIVEEEIRFTVGKRFR